MIDTDIPKLIRTKHVALALFITIAVGAGVMSSYYLGVAHADPAPVIVDAGVQAGSGSAVAVIPPVFHDPSVNPTAFVTDAINLWHTAGWPAGLMLLVVAVLELLAWAGKNYAPLAWLGTGRKSIAIAGGIAVGVAAVSALATGGSWAAVLSAAAAAALAYWHQAGTDPAKS